MARVTVAVPVRNEAAYIEQTLSSLAAQTYDDFEVIVADNASVDGTSKLCVEFCTKHSHFRYMRHPENNGAAYNCDYCLRETGSEYFMWLGGHDKISSNFLSEAVTLLDSRWDISIAGGLITYIDESGSDLPENVLLQRYSDSRMLRLLQSAVHLRNWTIVNFMFRRKLLDSQKTLPIANYDGYLLMYLLWFGNIAYSTNATYYRRRFADSKLRSAEYMLRMTGQLGVRRDLKPMTDLTLERFKPILKQEGVVGRVFMKLLAVLVPGRYRVIMRYTAFYLLARVCIPNPGTIPSSPVTGTGKAKCRR